MDELLTRYGLTQEQLERLLTYQGLRAVKPLALYLKEGDTYEFGAVSDTHLCSKEERLKELHTFYKLCKARGITDIYHSGDVLSGQTVYRGQLQEIHTFGCDNQVAYVVRNYPKEEGITTHFITGNHDADWFKSSGVDVGVAIAEKRPDMEYLGMYFAEVMLGNIKFMGLMHLEGGVAYALTYRAQRAVVELTSTGQKPRFLLTGHPHTSYQFLYRGVYVYGCGAFEGQTPFLARKGINPVIGGWIVKTTLGKDKKRSTVSVASEFVPFWD